MTTHRRPAGGVQQSGEHAVGAPRVDARLRAAAFPIAVVALGVGIPFAIALVTGGLSIPHNDSWAFSKVAETFATTGQIHLQGWGNMAVVGQVVILGPLGKSIVIQQTFVAVCAAVFLTACWLYMREDGVTRGAAAFAVLSIAAIPEFGLLSTSYMTDVPAATAMMVCVLLGRRAVRSESPWLLLAASMVGLWGVTIREQAILAPAVVALVALVRWTGRRRLIAVMATMVGLALAVGFELWRRRLAFGDSPVVHLTLGVAAPAAIASAYTLGLYLAPVLAISARPHLWRGQSQVVAGVTALLAVRYAITHHGLVFLGNYLDRSGAYLGAAVGSRVVIPTSLWWVLVVVACLGVGALTGVVLELAFRFDLVGTLLGVLVVAAAIGSAAVGQTEYSRYLLPAVPLLAASLLAWRPSSQGAPVALGRPRVGLVVGVPALVVMWCVSLVLTVNTLAFDSARWRASEDLVAKGYDPREIASGLEWVGTNADVPAVHGRKNPGAAWWVGMFEGSSECVIVSTQAMPETVSIATYRYHTYVFAGESALYAYHGRQCTGDET